ncbi:hypothetical protein FA13DRAFT_714503 [Coprinellus micaceus]|uniref:DUF6534 domain-containing protein n=1 Tax=Coprinellus micaceus TaxID=71717 RepID=A0A4Y7TUW6_COPMI|nr:hypothetical protein FA13DRAFT_714503 [Coprinellus micaceus]
MASHGVMNPIPTPVPPIAYAGPALLGAVFSYLLAGVLLVQIGQYSQNTGVTDRIYLRIMVVLVALCQALQLALVTQKGWRVLVLAFTTPELMVHQSPAAAAVPVLNGVVALMVQGFFVWRIRSIGSRRNYVRPISVVILLLSLLGFASSIAISVLYIRSGADSRMLYKLNIVGPLHGASKLVCDGLITVSMISVLYWIRRDTTFRRTHTLLNILIRNTIENGFITTAFVAAHLAVYCLRKQDGSNYVFQNILGFIYAIVLLTALNRRQDHRDGNADSSQSTDFNMHNLDLSTNMGSQGFPGSRTAPALVQIDQTRTVDDCTPVSK